MLAVAVADVVVPVKALLTTETGFPVAGIMVTFTVLPTGTPLLSMFINTGLVAVTGSTMSALPVGIAGAVTAATEVILTPGKPATNKSPGDASE